MLISFALAAFCRLIAIRAEILAQVIQTWSCMIDSCFWWLKLSEEKLFTANQRELTQTRKEEGEQKIHPPLLPAAWPGTVTSHLTLQMGCPESPKQPIYSLSLSTCMKEGENWAVVNLVFLSNQVILCSRSLKGNSCFFCTPTQLWQRTPFSLPSPAPGMWGPETVESKEVTAFQHFFKCHGGG